MSDFESPVIPGESLALTACRRTIARVRSCGNFAWYMNHTESLACCVLAVAEADGKDPEQLAKSIADAAVARIKKCPPDVELLRAEKEAMVNTVDEMVVERAADWSAYNLEDLLHHCRVTNQRPTVEAVETALGGQSLAHCLHQM